MYSDTTQRIIILLFIFFSNPLSLVWAASKQSDVKKGNEYYSKAQFDQSVEKYKEALKKDPESDIINFNLGTALYKKDLQPEAQANLRKALLSENKTLKQKAFYNLGNSLYKSGIAKEDKNVDDAIKHLEESVQQLQSAVGLDPKDEDAKSNLEFVRKELERLKKKKQQQQSQKNQNKDQSKDSQKDDQKNNQSQSSDQSKQSENKKEEQPSSQSQQNQDNKGQSSQSNSSQKDEAKDSSEDKSQQKQSQSAENQDQKKSDDSKERAEKPNKEDQQSSDLKQSSANQSGQDAGKPVTDKESEMLLENYEQNEAPKGMYQMKLKPGSSSDVEKDW